MLVQKALIHIPGTECAHDFLSHGVDKLIRTNNAGCELAAAGSTYETLVAGCSFASKNVLVRLAAGAAAKQASVLLETADMPRIAHLVLHGSSRLVFTQ